METTTETNVPGFLKDLEKLMSYKRECTIFGDHGRRRRREKAEAERILRLREALRKAVSEALERGFDDARAEAGRIVREVLTGHILETHMDEATCMVERWLLGLPQEDGGDAVLPSVARTFGSLEL